MKYFDRILEPTENFGDRLQEPELLPSAIGNVSITFAELEDKLAESIALLLSTRRETAALVTAEQSFKNKVHLLASLVRQLAPSTSFNCGQHDPNDVFSELAALCFTVEEKRNRILHSSWKADSNDPTRAQRKKTTAKARIGLRINNEEVDIGYIFYLTDITITVLTYLDDFFLDVIPCCQHFKGETE